MRYMGAYLGVGAGLFWDNGKKSRSVLDILGLLATMRMTDGIIEFGANQ